MMTKIIRIYHKRNLFFYILNHNVYIFEIFGCMKAHEKIHYFIINFDKPEKKKEQKMFFSTKLNPKCLNNTIYFSHSLQNQHTLLHYFLIANTTSSRKYFY